MWGGKKEKEKMGKGSVNEHVIVPFFVDLFADKLRYIFACACLHSVSMCSCGVFVYEKMN